MAEPELIVGIATFRRPQWLARCLRSLEQLELDRPVVVVVADNDCERREGVAICERLLREGFRLPLISVSVPRRGIAHARNALVAKALSFPSVDSIAMIDDDEWADPDWLTELLRVKAAFNADVVGGPVRRVFESPVPNYVSNGSRPEFRNKRDGVVSLIDATSNILFRADMFRARPAPWFDTNFGLMGGEDKDLLVSLRLEGKTFAWASSAHVTEEMPTSRCSTAWLIKRAFCVGNTDMLVNLKHRPPGFNLVSETAKILGAFIVAAFNLTVFVWYPPRRFAGIRLCARIAGKLAALGGARYEEYRVIHGR